MSDVSCPYCGARTETTNGVCYCPGRYSGQVVEVPRKPKVVAEGICPRCFKLQRDLATETARLDELLFQFKRETGWVGVDREWLDELIAERSGDEL